MEHKLAVVNSSPTLISLCKSIVDLLRIFASSSPAQSAESSGSPGEPPSVKLSHEIRTLSNVLETVRQGYGSDLYSEPSAVEARFWADIGGAVRDCKTNLQNLEQTLRNLAGEGSKGSALMSIFKSKKSQTRFNQANSEFTVYRHVAQSYREVLALSLEVSSLALQHQRQEKMEELKKHIARLSVLLRHRAASESVETDPDALRSIGALQACVASAASLLSEAVTKFQIPLEIDGHVLLAELDSTEAKSRRESQRSSVGTPRERLSQPSISSKSIEDIPVKGATMDVTSGIPAGIAQQPPQATQAPQEPPIPVPDTQVHELQSRDLTGDDDSDSDWEAELNAGLASIAQEKYDAGDYAGAESYLRKIVDGANAEEKYFVLLVVCLIRLGKWDEAEQVLFKLEKSPSQESVGRAQHYLAELYAGNGQLEKAKIYANKAMKGKGKLYGKKDTRTAQSIYLFVEILKLMKHVEEAASYSRLLPPDFKPEESNISKCFENASKEQKVEATVPPPVPVPAPAPAPVASPDDIPDILEPLSPAKRAWLEEFGLKLSADGLSIEGEPKDLADGRTVVHRACELNDHEVLQLLIKRGIPVNVRDSWQNSPLLTAVIHNHGKCVRVLCDKGRFGGMKAGVVIDSRNNGNWTALHMAAERGKEDIIRSLINSGADVNAEGGHQNSTPLHSAADHHKDNAITMLLGAGAEVDKTDSRSETPLQYACIHNAARVAKVLIERGADVNSHGFNGDTPLIRANFELSELLIANGANVNTPNHVNNWTPLMSAVERDISKKVGLLIQHGADVNAATTGNGFQPLHAAALHRRNPIAKQLIDAGADLNGRERNDSTPLYFAAAPIAEMLITAGADIEVENHRNGRPLHAAVLNDQPDVVKLLLRNNCQLNAQDADDNTPLHLAVQHQRKKCFQHLIEAGADVNIENNRGFPPLHCVEEGSKDMASKLLEKGADINVVDRNNSTALHHAVWRDQPGLVKLLLQNGAKHSFDNPGYTPLHGCSLHNRINVLRILLETRTEGFDLEAVDSRGKTPLILAAAYQWDKIVKLLVEAGANQDAKCNSGKTALEYATSKEVKALLEPKNE